MTVPADALSILAASGVLTAYAMRAAPDQSAALAALNLALETAVDGIEGGQPVGFGYVARHPTFGRGLFLRGTSDDAEGIRDMEAVMEDCPLAPGVRWHAGFGALYQTLTLPAGPFDFICGHSLGCPLGEYAALARGASAWRWFAPPKAWNEAGAAAARAAVADRKAYALRYDWIPRLPFYVPLIAPFVPTDDPIELDPFSVTPAIGLDPLSEHELVDYQQAVLAIP